MKKLLWLDDIRNPLEGDWLVFSPIENPYDVIWVKSYKEFTNWISDNGLPDAICFDHDLGDNFTLRENAEISDWFDLENNREFDGYDCTKWLVEYCIVRDLDVPKYNIQSANPVGKENINGLLESYRKHRLHL